MYTKEEVRQILENYDMYSRLVCSGVYDYDSTSIGQYGIESSMPKAQGTTGDKVLVRVLRNDKSYRRTQEMVNKMNLVDNNEHLITNEKTYHVLQMIKQGRSRKVIKELLKIGHENLCNRTNDIVNILYASQDNQNS
ncbi:hypothetical protein [Mammaliicoccus sciuri]|uniref:hypothetical protein n=1 Tax=Mammaliicoccus sciuri TaxID=1296 RepID=UPI00194E50A4|nr:hypothetical protein [Mammaliicoccus sciuri]